MEEKQPQEKFYKDTDKMFKEKLSSKRIMILDIEKNEILSKINYDDVMFDSKLNIYKTKKGAIERVYNSNFKAVVVEA